MDEHAPSAPATQPGTSLVAALPTSVSAIDAHDPVTTSDADQLRRMLNRTLDAVDEFADAVAHGLGLRER